MIKLLVASDIHNDFDLIKDIVKRYLEEKPDYVILLGDFASFGDIDIGVLEYLSKKIDPKKVIIIPGNHDISEVIYNISKKFGWMNLDRKYINIRDNISFVGIGGADILLYKIEEEEIKEFLDKIKEKLKGKYIILLTHMPPIYSSTSLNISGSVELSKFILENNPLANLHGHIHETGGLDDILGKTKIINSARMVRLVIIDDNKNIFAY